MANSTRWTRCTAQAEDSSFCDAPSIDGAPFPICIRHGAQLLQFLQGAVKDLNDEPFERRMAIMDNTRDRKQDFDRQFRVDVDRARNGRVYYVQVGQLVKIGYTARLKQRMNAYPPGHQLLAVEHGDEELETKRHRQFAGLLAERREWFTPGPQLLDHIDILRKQSGARPLTRRCPIS